MYIYTSPPSYSVWISPPYSSFSCWRWSSTISYVAHGWLPSYNTNSYFLKTPILCNRVGRSSCLSVCLSHYHFSMHHLGGISQKWIIVFGFWLNTGSPVLRRFYTCLRLSFSCLLPGKWKAFGNTTVNILTFFKWPLIFATKYDHFPQATRDELFQVKNTRFRR